MAGTREGGLKAAETNKKRHGKDFYKKAGSVKVPKGFALMSKEKHLEASSKGGSISRRTKEVTEDE